MLYLSYTPSAPLSHFVERMWLVSGGQEPRRERILPNGTVELVINLLADQIRIDRTMQAAQVQTFSGSVLSGTYSAAFVVDAMQHAAMMGIHFRPAGAFSVLGVPLAEFTNAHTDLAAIWGDEIASEFRERLCTAASHGARFRYVERILSERLRANRRVHPVVPAALDSFGADGVGAPVRDVARSSGLSHRRFLTVFRSEVGLAPKEFCRILRFQNAHATAQRTGWIDWSELALQCGFCDQPHLSNEFKRLSGLTPSQYERAIKKTQNLLVGHVAMP